MLGRYTGWTRAFRCGTKGAPVDRSRILMGLALTATVAAWIPSAANAAPDPIKGKLSKNGYTVIALAPDGRAATVDAKPKFRLVPPAGKVTLHLRDAKGSYAGPLVVPDSRKKVIVGIHAGAVLGKVKVKSGFAVAKNAEPGDIVTKMNARAKNGIPVGARVLGRVGGSAKGRSGLGRDPDRDALPGAFDV